MNKAWQTMTSRDGKVTLHRNEEPIGGYSLSVSCSVPMWHRSARTTLDQPQLLALAQLLLREAGDEYEIVVRPAAMVSEAGMAGFRGAGHDQ